MKRDRGHTHSVAALVLCGIASFVPGLACIGGGDGPAPASDAGAADDGGPTTVAPPLSLPAPTANITWAPTTTLIDQTQTSLVTSVHSANQVITLDSAGVKAAGLDSQHGKNPGHLRTGDANHHLVDRRRHDRDARDGSREPRPGGDQRRARLATSRRAFARSGAGRRRRERDQHAQKTPQRARAHRQWQSPLLRRRGR